MALGFSKFGRNYILLVQLQDKSILTVEPPFTIEFDITRNILTSSNVCSIRIYNLSKQNRNQIEFNIMNQTLQDFRFIQLIAGYGNNLATIFRGNITQAWSVREGVNFITQIECYDGGFAYANAQTSLFFPKNTPNQVVITALIASLTQSNVVPGAIGVYDGATPRAKAYSGNTTDILNQLTGGGFFIDNGFANALGNSEALIGPIPLIDASSGLLGTPVREQSIITFDMIFEPRLAAGQAIQLLSLTAAVDTLLKPTQGINGFYKVSSIKHRGMISESVCGDAITTVSMLQGNRITPIPGAGVPI